MADTRSRRPTVEAPYLHSPQTITYRRRVPPRQHLYAAAVAVRDAAAYHAARAYTEATHVAKRGRRVLRDVRAECGAGATGPPWVYALLGLLVAGYVLTGKVTPFMSVWVLLGVAVQSVWAVVRAVRFACTALVAAQVGYALSERAFGPLPVTLRLSLWAVALCVFPPGALLTLLVARACATTRGLPPGTWLPWREEALIQVYFTGVVLLAAHALHVLPLALAMGY